MSNKFNNQNKKLPFAGDVEITRLTFELGRVLSKKFKNKIISENPFNQLDQRAIKK